MSLLQNLGKAVSDNRPNWFTTGEIFLNDNPQYQNVSL